MEKENEKSNRYVIKPRSEEKKYSERLRRKAEIKLICDTLQNPQSWMTQLSLKEPQKKPEGIYKELQERLAKLKQEEYDHIQDKRQKWGNAQKTSGDSTRQRPAYRSHSGYYRAPFPSPYDPRFPGFFPHPHPVPPKPLRCQPLQGGYAPYVGSCYYDIIDQEHVESQAYWCWGPGDEYNGEPCEGPPFYSAPETHPYEWDFEVSLYIEGRSDQYAKAFIHKYEFPETQEDSWLAWNAEIYIYAVPNCMAASGNVFLHCLHTVNPAIDVDDEELPFCMDYKLEPWALYYSCNGVTGLDARHPVEASVFVPKGSVARLYIGCRIHLSVFDGWMLIYPSTFRIENVRYAMYPYPF